MVVLQAAPWADCAQGPLQPVFFFFFFPFLICSPEAGIKLQRQIVRVPRYILCRCRILFQTQCQPSFIRIRCPCSSMIVTRVLSRWNNPPSTNLYKLKLLVNVKMSRYLTSDLFSLVVSQNKKTSETRRAAVGLAIAVLRSLRSGLSSNNVNWAFLESLMRSKWQDWWLFLLFSGWAAPTEDLNLHA